MSIEAAYVPLDTLVALPRNSKLHALSSIGMSFQEFGFLERIVVNRTTGHIIGGHGRVEALRLRQSTGKAPPDGVELSKEEWLVPVDWVEVEEAKEEAAAIALNRLVEAGGWDSSMLVDVLRDSLLVPEVTLDMLGFDISTYDDLLLSVAPPLLELVNPVPQIDRAEELHEKWGTAKGQIWVAGAHRIMCGDSTNAGEVALLLDGVKAAACVTDPPYGIGFEYDSYNDTREQWFELMDKVLPIIHEVASFVVMPCCGINRLDWWYTHHRPDWIMCWYKGSQSHHSYVGFNDWEPHLVWGKPSKLMHDYWQTVCGFEVEGPPCPKPVAYSEWLVEHAAVRGGIVFDPFMGSGTTLVACENLARVGYGMEISPAYTAVSLQRLADKGLTPRLLSSESTDSTTSAPVL